MRMRQHNVDSGSSGDSDQASASSRAAVDTCTFRLVSVGRSVLVRAANVKETEEWLAAFDQWVSAPVGRVCLVSVLRVLCVVYVFSCVYVCV